MAVFEHVLSLRAPEAVRARRAQFNSFLGPGMSRGSRGASLSCAFSTAALVTLCGCAGTGGSREKVYAPEDMPDICQDIDFNQAGADLKAECGVQTRNYMAYRNIPEHRNLLLPKGAKIVQKGKGLELRLTNTLPIGLPEAMDGKILFDENLRRTFLKDRMDYCEFFPEHATDRMRILRLDIPLDVGGQESVCFSLGSPPATTQRKAGFAGRLEHLDCADFEKLKSISRAQGLPMSENAAGDSSGTKSEGSDTGPEKKPGH